MVYIQAHLDLSSDNFTTLTQFWVGASECLHELLSLPTARKDRASEVQLAENIALDLYGLPCMVMVWVAWQLI